MSAPLLTFWQVLLAASPILFLLALMVGLRWGAQRAGPVSWLLGVGVAALAFGLTFDAWWVSQARGVLLALYVLAVLWPALLLYNLVDRTGGIRALAEGMRQLIADRGLLLVTLAWAFSGLLEGLAGFGLPVAVVSPMLAALGVEPVLAVAAVAIGHAWSVTFGDMGVIFQTLIAVSKMDGQELAPAAALMCGVAAVLCGLACARLLAGRQGGIKLAAQVTGLGLLMAGVQYGLAVGGLAPLAAFGAGLAGMAGAAVIGRGQHAPAVRPGPAWPPALIGALAAYGGLAALMGAIAWPGALRAALFSTAWSLTFPEVATRTGFITPAGPGQVFRPLVHPGTAILLAALLAFVLFRRARLCAPGDFAAAARATWRSAAPASLGILSTVCLSTLMEHAGMTQLLAQAAASLMGAAFPLVSPLVGILGAFATGSNNNSNVLFAPLQKSVAGLLNIDPRLLLGAQTAGGALGSMLAPAKITVGCSTVGLKGREGDVLRRTLLVGLVIGMLIGALALGLAS